MATVYVSIGKAGIASTAGAMPCWEGDVSSETITSSGTAASGALEAGGKGFVAKIHCATAVYASTTGTASATNGVYIAAGIPEYIGIKPGDTVSVIDV